MALIKVRSPEGGELAFNDSEEFSRAVGTGSITAAWEIFHQMRNLWVPIAVHPMFQTLAAGLYPPAGDGFSESASPASA